MKRRIQPKDLIEYEIELFGWDFVVVYLYRTIAFKVVFGLSLVQSNWVFWSVWLMCILLALAMTPTSSRSNITVCAPINAPVTIYLIISVVFDKSSFQISEKLFADIASYIDD